MRKFGNLPRRGKLGSLGNLRRTQKVCKDLNALGKLYRAEVPREQRSYRAWLTFISQRAPLYMGRGA